MLLIALLFMLGMLPAFAQNIANYAFSTSTSGSLEDLTSGATSIMATGEQDDVATAVQAIGFDFYFMGVKYTHFSANSNGQVRLHTSATATAISGGNISGYSSGVNTLAPMAGDNELAGGMKMKVIGSAPNRKIVVEWTNFYVYFSPTLTNAGNMQLWLEENGAVSYVYGDIYNSGSSSVTRSIFISSGNTAGASAHVIVGTAPTVDNTATAPATNTFAAGSGTVTGAPLIANLGSSSNTARRVFKFTPSTVAPANPVLTAFTVVTPVATTVNWTDNSTTELAFIVTRATDEAFTQNVVTTTVPSITTAATGGAYSLAQSSLNSSVTYYYKVQALREAAISTGATASQATAAPAVYTWLATSGTASWITATNWSPARTTTDATDILQFSNGGTPIVTDVPAQTIRRLSVTNNTAIKLRAASAVTLTLASDGTAAEELLVEAGSSLVSDGGTATLSITYSGTGSTGTIAGSIEAATTTAAINNTFLLSGGTGSVTTISGNATISQVAGTTGVSLISGNATTLIFTSTGIYNHKYTTIPGTIPTATWQAGSTVLISGYTTVATTPAIAGFSQTFSNLTWNCQSQVNAVQLNGATFTVGNTFTVANTGTGELRLADGTSPTITVNNYVQTAGNLVLNTGAGSLVFAVSGSFNQTGGTFHSTGNTAGTPILLFNGTSTQNVSFYNAAPTGVLTYRISNNSGINLSGTGTLTSLFNINTGGVVRISSTAATPVNTSLSLAYGTGTTLMYDAAGPATVPASLFPATNGPASFTVAVGTGNVLILPFSRTIPGTLTLTSGDLDISSNVLTIGTTAAAPGALSYTAGKIRITTGSLTRWFSTTGLAASAGTGVGYFPLAAGTDDRSVSVYGSAQFTTGGSITIGHNNVAGFGIISPSVLDGAYSIDKRTSASWAITAGNGLATAGSTMALRITGANLFVANSVANLRVMQAAAVTGIHVAGTGTAPNYQASRSGLSVAQLAQTQYIGSGAADASLMFTSIASGNWSDGTTWDKGYAPGSADAATIANGHNVTLDGANTIGSLIVNTGGTLTAAANSLAALSIVNSGTITVNGAAITVTGASASGITNATATSVFTLNSGTVTLGAAGGSNRTFANAGTLTVAGGTLNINGNLSHTAATSVFTQSAGLIKIDGNAAGVAANSVASGAPLFNSLSTSITLSGGTLLFVDPHTATSASSGYTIYLSNSTISTASLAASPSHLTQFGDGVSTDAGGHTSGFYINNWTSNAYLSLGSVKVNGATGTNRGVTSVYLLTANGNVEIAASSTLTLSGALYIAGNLNVNAGGTFINSGVLLATKVIGNTNSTLTTAANTVAQTFTNNGTLSNATTSPTANLYSLTIENSSAGGVTLASPISVSNTLTLTAGKVNTTATNLLALGTATATATLVGGSSTAYIDGPFARTFAANRTATGTYTAATLFPVGKGTSYLPVNIDPTTTAAGAVVFKGEAFTANGGTPLTGVTTLSANRWEALPVTGAANLTNAFVRIGDGAITANNKIVQATAAAGQYGPIIPATTFATGTLTTTTAITAAAYKGYFAYGDLNPCTLPADQPANFVASAITSTTFTGTYTAAASAPSNYLVVRYASPATATAPADYTAYTVGAALGTGTVAYVGTGLTFNATGLSAATQYTYYVYSYNNSACYGPVYNTTAPLTATVTTCPAIAAPGTPAAATSPAVGITSFRAQWTASATAGVTYEIDVATNTGFTTFVTGYQALNVGTDLFKDITNLTQGTTYYVRVRAQSGACYSAYTSTLTINTQSVTTAPWTEPFATASTTPTGWTTTGWTIGSVRGVTGNPGNNIYKNIFTTGSSGGLFTTINVGALPANYQFAFDYKVANYDTPYGAPAVNSGNFVVAISTDFGATYTDIATIANDGVAGWRTREFSLAAYTGATVKFKITGNWTEGDYDLAFDNVRVEAQPDCLRPTALTAVLAGATSANLSWSAPATGVAPAGYEYAVTTSATAPASGTFQTGTSLTAYTVPANTTSYLYVRSKCAEGIFSAWQSVSFYTGYCTPTTTYPDYQYITSFSTTGGYSNIASTTASSGSGAYTNNTAQFVSQSLGTPVNYSIGFYDDFADSDYEGVGAAIYIDWNGDLDFNDANETVYASGLYYITSPITGSITIPAGTPVGNYVMRVRIGYDYTTPLACGADSYGEAEDFTFRVIAVSTCFVPTAITAAGTTATGTTLTWTAPATGTAPVNYEYEVRTAGAAGSGATGRAAFGTVSAATASIAGLASATSYTVYVRSSCGSGNYSDWASSAFTTLCGTATLPLAEGFNATTTIPSCWSTAIAALQTATKITYVTTGSSPATSPSEGANMVLYNSFSSANGGAGSEERLITKAFSTTGISSIDVKFDFRNENSTSYNSGAYLNEGVQVQYSFDGTTWVNAGSFYARYDSSLASGTAQWNAKTVVITDVAEHATVYIAFKFHSEWGDNMYLDNVAISRSATAITSFTPAAVCEQSGPQTVTITGRSLTGATAVKFNGVNATSFTVVNGTTITAITPAGLTAGNITVDGVFNTAISPTALAITANPVVADITGGGATICAPSTVQLANATPAGVWSSSDAAIATVNATGLVTGVAAGTATITYRVTTSGCSTAKTTTVTVNAPVAITSVTPSQAVTPSGTATYIVAATGTSITYQWEVSINSGGTYTAVTNGAEYSGATSATLTVSNVSSSHNGYLYRVVVSGAAPCAPVTSAGSILTVSEIGIVSHPVATTVCSDPGTAQFTVSATGSNLSYHWQEDQGGNNWQPLTNGIVNGVTYAGTATATLSLSGVTTANSGWKYRVYLTDDTSSTATSNPATLTAYRAVAVSVQPGNKTVCATGGTETFSVTATGSGLTYQWQYATAQAGPWASVANAAPAGVTYTGATTATLSVTTTAATPVTGTYYYRAVLTGTAPCGPATTDAAQLIINNPAFTSQPGAATIVAGNTGVLTAAVSANAATYQWQYATSANGTYTNVADATPANVTYTGATTTSLSVVTTQSAFAGTLYYKLVVTSGSCSVTSGSTAVTISNYCIPSFSTTNANTGVDVVNTFAISSTTLNASPGLTGASPYYYALLTGAGNTATLLRGLSYTANIAVGSGGDTQGVGVWIDINNDFDFDDAGEFLGQVSIISNTSGTISLAIPASTSLGTHRLRIRNIRNATLSQTSVCAASTQRGTTVDFNVTIDEAPVCTGTPAAGIATANTNNICSSGTAVLSATGYPTNVSGITFNWYNSTGIIADATSVTYTTPVLTANMTYYLRATCTGSGLYTDTNPVTISVYSAGVAGTTPATRCGTGTVSLAATGLSGNTLKWYTASTGGSAVGTGTTFTTPSISTTTTYHVEAIATGTAINAGITAPAVTTSSVPAGYGLVFSATSAFTLNSVNVYPNGAAGTITIQLQNSSGTVLQTLSAYALPAGTGTTAVTVPLGWSVPTGTGYRLIATSASTSSIVRDSSTASFPYAIGNFGSITGGYVFGSSTIYNYFYNLSAAPSCTTARTAVIATVTPAPALTLSAASTAVCAGSTSSVITVTSNTADYTVYSWSPAEGVSGTAATGFTFSPAAATVYTLTATNASGCINTTAITVNVNALPAAPVIAPVAATICNGEIVTLSATAVSNAQITSGTATTLTTASTTGTALGPNPLQTYYGGTKQQWLYTASELTALGFTANTAINAIALTLGATDGTVLNNLVVKVKNSSKTSFPSTAGTNWETDLTTVRAAASYTPVAGLNTFAFSTPFVWNGTSSLVIEINYSNNNGGASSVANNATYSATSFSSTIFYRVDSTTAAAVDAFTGTATNVYSTRNNVVFSTTSSSAISWTPGTGLYTDAAATTAYTGGTAANVYARPLATTTYTATATNSNSCVSAATKTVTIGDKQWTGTVSTEWTTPGNWCGNRIPTATDNVIVGTATNQPVITAGTAVAKNLTVSPGATLVVNTGATLSVQNTLTTTGATVTVQNNAALIQGTDVTANTNTGSVSAVKVGNALYRYDYTLWSSPVSGTQTLSNFSQLTVATRFYEYGFSGDANYYLAVPGTTTFTPAKSYLIRMPDTNAAVGADYYNGITPIAFTGTFTGTPNNGTVTIPASVQGTMFTAVGNPYPSPISVEDFFTANAGVMNGSSGLYFWRKRNNASASSYATLTLAAYTSNSGFAANPSEGGGAEQAVFFPSDNVSSWLISQGQGFFVKTATNPTGSNITFTNAMRRPSPGATQAFFRTGETTTSRYWLNLTDGLQGFSQVAVAYMDNATLGLDYGYDGRQFSDGGNVTFYSLAEDTRLSIQARPEFAPADIVPMGFKAVTTGEFTVSIDHKDGLFEQGQDIYLKDNLLGVYHDLGESGYTFTSEAGTFNDRFEIVYTTDALGTKTPQLDPNSVIVYKQGNTININSGTAEMTGVTIYDIRGRKLYSNDKINATKTAINSLQVAQEVLIVEINTVKGKVSKRIVF
ncbi:GEVED domain-containing protein [Flavobacterium rivuli]|nr:GEVED domain-containing protein [Flavobacterium rivuli]